MDSSPLSPVLSGARSRSPEADAQHTPSLSLQTHTPVYSYEATADEAHDNATHVSDEHATPRTSTLRGKRRTAAARSGARKRMRSGASDVVEDPVAGPSRLLLPENGADALDDVEATRALIDEDDFNNASVASDTATVTRLLYPEDDLESPIPEEGRISSGYSTATATPLRRQRAFDVDSLPEPAETAPTSLAAQASSSTVGSMSLARLLNVEDNEVASPVPTQLAPSRSSLAASPRPPRKLATYNCPICFSPPTYATMTPCGHVCCGECLFTAVKTSIQRSVYHGPASSNAK
ncbi:hypothetical protein EIP91_010224 [Steccherinum ochraceum]|uniref:Zinc finger C3HC4 RING-type domain-containing protein n=1 Tax=Steccherinum ochraceum TaxID=92696 RepID=A0A4R0R8U5_9APHY|nr:hypothetical protein EIP91_010224 [Steccherinum ochraceum]